MEIVFAFVSWLGSQVSYKIPLIEILALGAVTFFTIRTSTKLSREETAKSLAQAKVDTDRSIAAARQDFNKGFAADRQREALEAALILEREANKLFNEDRKPLYSVPTIDRALWVITQSGIPHAQEMSTWVRAFIDHSLIRKHDPDAQIQSGMLCLINPPGRRITSQISSWMAFPNDGIDDLFQETERMHETFDVWMQSLTDTSLNKDTD
ncbi:hypothetical protein [Leucobacter luti]|uniref:hypothetical protein n=1 Tax=Leucobacter luti TaxID=340320 RepID=UPI001C68AFD5|nr:hypothetical protein [Leucobacter luti]QYM75594.1 hypothetical protein K1X41_13385 [Leucobacter luti]